MQGMSQDQDGAGRVDHDCLEHLVFRSREWYETHGLECGPFEHCYQEWWECAVCGNQITEDELAYMAEE